MATRADTSAIHVPMDVEYQPAWLTWVASTTTCLRALGVDCDTADVAGFSGYAFHLGVHEETCPSGPTVLDWSRLARGAHALGRATIELRSPGCSDAASETSRRAVFDMVRGEIEAGRPCVLWGTYVPEFGVAVGAEDEAYQVKTFREVVHQEQPPIHYGQTQTPGGVYALGFPAEAECQELQRDLEAILEALRHWERAAYGPYRFGADGYDAWIEALEAGRAGRFGCGYNAACYAEGRRFAHRFLERMSPRRPRAADLLRRAAEAYGDAAREMGRLSDLFPFGHEEQGPITATEKIERAVGFLAGARDSEARAMDALRDITRIGPRQ